MEHRTIIAGLTRPQDAALAIELGATDLGCEIMADSPRRVTPERAKEIFQTATRKTECMLMFQSAPADEVIAAAEAAGVNSVMMSAGFEPEICAVEATGITVYRIHEVPTGTNLLPPLLPEPSRKQPVLLTVSATAHQVTFPWEILGNEAPEHTIVGGNVRPENVCALLTHHPFGILVNSGLELEPGIKDADRMTQLFDTLENGF